MNAKDRQDEQHRVPERDRLHKSFQDDRKYLEKMVGYEKDQRASRADAVMALKGSIDRSATAIQARNTRREQVTQARLQQDAQNFHQLLQQGKNPYEVARTREVKATAQRERQQLERAIQDKQVALLERLEVEKVWLQRRERIADEQREYERKYQREMGTDAADARTEQYLVSRTGKETLDPSGKKFRIYPSQETTIKDHSFGLGKNLVHNKAQRRAIVEKVYSKPGHRDTAPSSMLLPRYGREEAEGADEAHENATHVVGTSNNAESSAGFASATTSTPGQELRGMDHAIIESGKVPVAVTLPPIARKGQPSSQRAGEEDAIASIAVKKGFGKPKRSVLEERMLTEKRERQKSNIFQKQIVWGKEFTGRAFLSDPPELWFRDFDVGVPMALHFTLTNVSNTFNHFKLLPLDDTIRECFEISFEKPGRMSAGTACHLKIVFTALQALDIESELPALAQTGAFSVPLRCTCKKAVPVMAQQTLRFEDVVAGEKCVKTLTLENQGALPLDFQIQKLSLAVSDRERITDQEPIILDGAGLVNIEGCEGEESETRIELAEANPQETEGYSIEQEHGGVNGSDGLGVNAEGKVEANLENGEEEETNREVDGEPHFNGGEVNEDIPDDDGIHQGNTTPRAICDEIPAAGGIIASSANEDGVASAHLLAQELLLSETEQALLDNAISLTVYKPNGADADSQEPVVLRYTRHGTVPPYSTIPISFTFAPVAAMNIENEMFQVAFTSPPKSVTPLHTLTPICITVAAQSTQVPIFVTPSILDFKCCLYDRLYRHRLVVSNRGKVALKMQLRVPKALEDSVEFNPNMGYVQAAKGGSPGEFPVQVKFRPRGDHPKMWQRLLRKGWGDPDLGFLAVPIQIVVPDQVVPVFVTFTARLSSSDLVFSMRQLDFGYCAVGHAAAHKLTITNPTRIAQRFGFVKLPTELRIASMEDAGSTSVAGDGITSLLPGESKIIQVFYQPSTARNFSGKLVCCSSGNHEYVLPVVAQGISSAIVFSQTVVRLAATQLGQRTTHSIICTNSSDHAQSLEVMVPTEAVAVLRVAPTVAVISPKQSVQIELEFTATPELFDLPGCVFADSRDHSVPDDSSDHLQVAAETSDCQVMTSAPVSVSVNQSQVHHIPLPEEMPLSSLLSDTIPCWLQSRGVPQEEKSVHHTWTLLCFSKSSVEKKSVSSAAIPSNIPVGIQVETTAIEPKLLASPTSLVFGQVAIGQHLVRELELTNNNSELDIVLRAEALHVLGGFRMVNALNRPLTRDGGSHTVKIEFRPQAAIRYEDELELWSPSVGVIRVPLRGEGINPSLSITPVGGLLDFADVLARNSSTLEFTFTNSSTFPLTYRIAPLLGSSLECSVFTFSPSEATIPAESALPIAVTFTPMRFRPEHYSMQFLVQVPNESERHVLSLTGRCWENQIYVFNPTEPDRLVAAPAVEDPFDLPPSVNLSALLGNGSNGIGSLLAASTTAGIQKPTTQLTVVFPDDEARTDGDTRCRTVYIGSTLPPGDEEHASAGAGGKAATGAAVPVGSFEFTVDDKGTEHATHARMFSLEPMKGVLSVDQQLPVQILFQPPALSTGGNAPGTCEDNSCSTEASDIVVAQWIQVNVTCTLIGGFMWRQLPSSSVAAANGKNDADTRIVKLVLRAKLLT